MDDTSRKMNIKFIIVILLALSLLFTSTILALTVLPINNNIFRTGFISIKLGGVSDDGDYYFDNGHKLVSENEYLFEPGSTIVKKFFIENITGEKGNDVYYKIYFENVGGLLADQIDVCLKDNLGNIVYEGKADNFIEDNAIVQDIPLPATNKTKHYYIITFHYPEECGNVGQGKTLEFDLCAKAVQVRNNPDKEFE